MSISLKFCAEMHLHVSTSHFSIWRRMKSVYFTYLLLTEECLICTKLSTGQCFKTLYDEGVEWVLPIYTSTCFRKTVRFSLFQEIHFTNEFNHAGSNFSFSVLFSSSHSNFNQLVMYT